MRKECPTLHGYPNLGIGTESRTMDVDPFPGSQNLPGGRLIQLDR